jgi:hypothetical protein
MPLKHFGTIALEQNGMLWRLGSSVRRALQHDIGRKICEFPAFFLQKASALT